MSSVYAEEFGSRIAGARVEVLEGCGHVPQVEKQRGDARARPGVPELTDKARYVVRFSGDLSKQAAKALRTAHWGASAATRFFAEPLPYSTTVVLYAESPEDAVARVRSALDGLGDFAGFESASFSAPDAQRSTT